MPIIADFDKFQSLHWETGTICNVLAYQGVKVPKTGQPFSEAMLLGLSGGVSVLYFVFEYENEAPHLYIGTRYPFDAFDATCSRLGIKMQVQETTSPKVASANLLSVLETGQPAIVWADMNSLPYAAPRQPSSGAGMMPLIVYGLDETAAYVSDRSAVPLKITPADLVTARARQGSTRHRLVTLARNTVLNDLETAIRDGVNTCVALYTEKPPKGPKANFGLAAMLKWADQCGNKKGWPRLFKPGKDLYNTLIATFGFIEFWGTGGSAARGQYADFLTEASQLLTRPTLDEAADMFRLSAKRWNDLALVLLPDSVPPLRETRELLTEKHRLFAEQGMEAHTRMLDINQRLDAIQADVSREFPVEEITLFYETIRDAVFDVQTAEQSAVSVLQAAL